MKPREVRHSAQCRRIRTAGLLLMVCVGLHAGVLLADTQLASLEYSPDVTVVLGSTVVEGGRIAFDDLNGDIAPIAIGDLPPGVRVSGYELLGNGEKLLSFDTTVDLSAWSDGPLIARPTDLVRLSGTTYSGIALDTRASGVPAGTLVDAIASIPSGSGWAVSFDTTVVVGGVTVADEDLLAYDGSDYFLVFDGSAAGVPENLDLDGAHQLDNGNLLLSFDNGGSIGGIFCGSADVLEYEPGSGVWRKLYDGTANGWPAGANLSAFAARVPLSAETTTPTPATPSSATPAHTASETPAPSATSTAAAESTVTPTAPTKTVAATDTPTPSRTNTPTTTLPGATATATRALCFGDCNESGSLTASDIGRINSTILRCSPCAGGLAGGAASGCAGIAGGCIAADFNGDGCIRASELGRANQNILRHPPNGCPPPTP